MVHSCPGVTLVQSCTGLLALYTSNTTSTTALANYKMQGFFPLLLDNVICTTFIKYNINNGSGELQSTLPTRDLLILVILCILDTNNAISTTDIKYNIKNSAGQLQTTWPGLVPDASGTDRPAQALTKETTRARRLTVGGQHGAPLTTSHTCRRV